MSTRSAIAISQLNGSIHSVYCHSDGYISWNGYHLYQYYHSRARALRLISFGRISSITAHIGEKHDFDDRSPNWCKFYSRDRDEAVASEDWSSIREFKTQVWDHYNAEYVYLWRANTWWVSGDDPDVEWTLLHDAVRRARADEGKPNLVAGPQKFLRPGKKSHPDLLKPAPIVREDQNGDTVAVGKNRTMIF